MHLLVKLQRNVLVLLENNKKMQAQINQLLLQNSDSASNDTHVNMLPLKNKEDYSIFLDKLLNEDF